MPVLLPFGPLQTMSSSCATCWLIPSESKSHKTVPGLVWSRPAQANVCCCEQIKSNKQLACCLHIPCCEYILVTRHFEFRRRLQRPHNDPSAQYEDILPVYYEVNQTKAAFVRKICLVLHVIRICLDLRHVILIALGNLGRTCRLKLCLDMLEAAVLNQCQNRIEPNLIKLASLEAQMISFQ